MQQKKNASTLPPSASLFRRAFSPWRGPALKSRLASAVLFITALMIAPAHAAWPERPVTLIVPFGAGGNTDILARALAQEMSRQFGQTFIVENRPGAGSMIGSNAAARARPDGYTFLLGGLATVLNEHLYKKPLVDIRKDLVPVSLIATVPNYLSVSPSLPVTSTAELLAMVRKEPGKYSCANSGVGTSTHLSCEMLRTMAGLNMIMVPYKSGADAIMDVMAGRATMVLVNEALPYIRDNRLKGLGVTSAASSLLTPDLPPVAREVPGYDVTSWYAFFAPAGTPGDVIGKFDGAVRGIVRGQAMRQQLVALGATGSDMDAGQFAVFVEDELKKWGDVIRPLNLQLD